MRLTPRVGFRAKKSGGSFVAQGERRNALAAAALHSCLKVARAAGVGVCVMKIFALAAALMISGAAIAQTPPPPADPPAPADAPPAPAPDLTSPPADPAAPDASGPMPSMPAMPKGLEAVIPAVPGTGATAATPAAPVMGAPVAQPAPAAPATYPRCSRTVTDGCAQDMSRESDTRGGPPARKRKRR
jgi:hypothetical protein